MTAPGAGVSAVSTSCVTNRQRLNENRQEDSVLHRLPRAPAPRRIDCAVELLANANGRRRTLTAAFQSCFSAVSLMLATPYLTSFGDERVRAWGEYARFIVFLDHSARYCHVSC